VWGNIIKRVLDIGKTGLLKSFPGEITHAPAEIIPKLARQANELGAKIIVVHGEPWWNHD
jgi:hypothetical protein